MKCTRCGNKFRYTGKTVYCKDCWKHFKEGWDKNFTEIFPEVVATLQNNYKKDKE